MTETLRIAIVGCGGMMNAHVRKGFAPLWKTGFREFEIVACCDLREDAAAGMAGGIAEWQGKKPAVYTGVDALLEHAGDFDAADVSLVHSEHHAVAVPILERKKHLLIEKPLALTLRAGRAILDAAEDAGVVLSVAENYRRAPAQRTANWAIRSGRIGEPRQIYWLDCRERQWYWAWRDHKDKAGGGWLLDGGVHFTDLMRYHLGPVSRVTALCRQYDATRYRNRETLTDPVQATIEDTSMALLEFESGVTGVWAESIVSPGQALGRRMVYGSEGSLDLAAGVQRRGEDEPTSMEALKAEYMAQLGDDEKQRLFPFGLEDTVLQEIHEFVNACLHGGAVETDGMEGYRAQAVCMAVYESAERGGRPVDIADVESLEIEDYQRPLNCGLRSADCGGEGE